MLIRIVIENVFSFGKRKEFNMLPNKRLKTLLHHIYSINNFDLLKMTSLYGANGAGKSNLVKALYLLQKLVNKEEIPIKLKDSHFKFNKNPDKKQSIVVEFFQDNTSFIYGIEIQNGFIITEELYKSGLGKEEDKLIFERTTNDEGETKIKFLKEFEEDIKSQVLKSVLLEEFVKPDESIIKLLSNRDNKFLKVVKKAYKWFDETLQIITPESKPRALAQFVETDLNFKKYAENLMCSLNLGITSLKPEKKEIKDFFGEDSLDEIEFFSKKVQESPKKMIGIHVNGREIIIVKENKKIWVKQVKIGHLGGNEDIVFFNLDEESDGTIRLLDFIPAFKNVISKPKIYFVDEIERSIHPLLIKELVRKFSADEHTLGQLIFTTHESNLLDQSIFRQDEIWFVEKDKTGTSDIYSLSDFKEHKTIDIRKGYLNGRYGSIPFLANLHDLNWHVNDINSKAF